MMLTVIHSYIGCVLSQGKRQDERLVAFDGRKLRKSGRGQLYDPTQEECVAVVFADNNLDYICRRVRI